MPDDRPLSVPARRHPAGASSDLARPWQPVASNAAAGAAVTTRVRDRLQERKAAQRARVRRTWIRRGALVAAAAVLVWVVAASPLLALDEDRIEVLGVDGYVSADQVHALVDPYAG